ncbi:MAG: YceD family protein [Limisphaerales bacterium]
MPIGLNIRELALGSVHLIGQIGGNELGLQPSYGLVHIKTPITYRLTAALELEGVRVQGSWKLLIECTCVRCLLPFFTNVTAADWVHVIEIEEGAKCEAEGPSIDLATELREDILLSLPRHPVCSLSRCRLPLDRLLPGTKTAGDCACDSGGSAWKDLDKLVL